MFHTEEYKRMKKSTIKLIVGVVWILVALYFFYISKTGVAVCWFMIGLVNLSVYSKKKKATIGGKIIFCTA